MGGGAAVDAAGAGSGRGATGVTADGLVRLGVDDGAAAGRGAVDVAAERCGVTFGAAVVVFGEAFLAAAMRFGFGFCVLVFVARRTVAFAAGFFAFVVRLTSCPAAAALPVFLLALLACFSGRFATVALLIFLMALANRLMGRLAVVLRPSVFASRAARPAADFPFPGFARRLAFIARPDDFDALLFFETAAAIEPSLLLPARIACSSKLRPLPLVLQPKSGVADRDSSTSPPSAGRRLATHARALPMPDAPHGRSLS